MKFKRTKVKKTNYQHLKECVEHFQKIPFHLQKLQCQYELVKQYAAILQMHEIGFIDVNNDDIVMVGNIPHFNIDIEKRLKNRVKQQIKIF